MLDQAHRKRNLAGYEGHLEVDHALVEALIRVAQEVATRRLFATVRAAVTSSVLRRRSKHIVFLSREFQTASWKNGTPMHWAALQRHSNGDRHPAPPGQSAACRRLSLRSGCHLRRRHG